MHEPLNYDTSDRRPSCRQPESIFMVIILRLIEHLRQNRLLGNHGLTILVLNLSGLIAIGILCGGLAAAAGTNDMPPAKYAPLVTLPPMMPGIATNPTYTNAHDAYEAWLLSTVDDTKRQLEQTNLNKIYRESLEWFLRSNQQKLTNHQEEIQRQADFVKSVKANSRTAWTNMPDPISEGLVADQKAGRRIPLI